VEERRVAELAPQSQDHRFDRGGERVGHLVPHPLQQLLGGDYPAAGGEQAFEDGELFRAQLQPSAGAERHPAVRVEDHLPVVEHRRHRGRGPPRQGADAGDQFGEIERLGQVVVGAEAESLHAVPDGAGRGQH
jgi:hypothetical protein